MATLPAAPRKRYRKHKPFCVYHVVRTPRRGPKPPLKSFRYDSWCAFLKCAQRWKRLDCFEGKVALDSEAILGINLDSVDFEQYSVNDHEHMNLPIPAIAKFHVKCYRKFCNRTMIGREEKRQEKRDQVNMVKEDPANMAKDIITGSSCQNLPSGDKPGDKLSFCEDCGVKRVRDVEVQLQQLFFEKSWEPSKCGICSKVLDPCIATQQQDEVSETEATSIFENDENIDCFDDQSDVEDEDVKEDHDLKNHEEMDVEDDGVKKDHDLKNHEEIDVEDEGIKEAHDLKDHELTLVASGISKSEEANCETSRRTTRLSAGVIQAPDYLNIMKCNLKDLSESDEYEASEDNFDESDDDPLFTLCETSAVIPKPSNDHISSLAPTHSDRSDNDPLACETNAVLPKPSDLNEDMPSPAPIIDLTETTKWLDSRVVAMMDTNVTNPNALFKCKHCKSKDYQKLAAFLKHMNYSHQQGFTITHPYKCDKCSRQFSSNQKLQVHLTSHSENRPFPCSHAGCQSAFKTKSTRYSHEATHKPEKRPKPHMCSNCGRCFVSQSKLIKHEVVHSTHRPYKCPQCHKSYKLKDVMERHVRAVHEQDKKCMCDICGRAYFCMKDMIIHMRIHSGEKPFSCDQCNYRCARKDYLDKHLRVHTGEKPYKCTYCSMAFSNRTSLTLHLKKHHPGHLVKTEQMDFFEN